MALPHQHPRRDAGAALYQAPGSAGGHPHAESPFPESASKGQAPHAASESGGFLGLIKRVFYTIIPPGGILASAFNLASCSIGAGILGLPAATDRAGLVMALLYLVFITIMSVFSMHLLAIVALKTNVKTFEGLARELFPAGRYAFSYFVAFIRWFHAFGACIGYVISVGNCMEPMLREAAERHPSNSSLAFLATANGNRLLTTAVWSIVMLPLVIPKHIDTLRYASTIAVSFMIYFVLAMVAHSANNGLSTHIGHIQVSNRGVDSAAPPGDVVYLFRTGNDALGSLGTFMFAYVCQMAAYEVLWDLSPPIRTVRHYTLASFIGMFICGILYCLVCFFSYLDFGSAAIGDRSALLLYRPLSEPSMFVGYIGVLIKICVAYALLGMAARNSVYYMIGWQQRYAPRLEGRADAKSDESSGPAALEPADESYVDAIPFWKHLIVVLTLAVTSLILGLFIPNIGIVFGFAGSISGGFMAFVFPALFYLYAGNFSLREVGFWHYLGTYVLLLSGVTGIVFGTSATIYATITG